MIAIDRMETDLRLAGNPAARAHMARRLDRIARERVGDVLDTVLREFAAEDGPVYRIRRLDLTLWLHASRLDDAAIARSWAGSIARALYRQIAEGGPTQVMRYPSQAAFVAAWLSDMVAGRAAGHWQYAEFATLSDLPAGRAAAFVLGREPRSIAPTFRALAAADRLEAVVAQFGRRDVESLWRAWTDAAPLAPARIDPDLLARARGVAAEPPAAEAGGADARARTALRWLVALSTGRGALPAPSAAGLALQLAHLAALLQAVPALRNALQEDGAVETPRPKAAAAGLAAAAEWLGKAAAVPSGGARLRDLVRLLEPKPPPRRWDGRAAIAPERIVSPFAGLALLLPSIRRLELAPLLGPAGLQLLLVAAVPERQRIPVRGDPALRWMSGLPRHVRLEALPPVAWPDGPADPRDAATHGDGPELPTLRRVLDDFAAGLRGMEPSSAGYLAAQFLCRSGTMIRSDGTLRVRLSDVPLGLLLRIGGRLGPRGALDWLEGRELVLEVADG